MYPLPIGDDQNKVKRPLYQGFANTPVLCITLSVLRDLHWLPLVISRFPSITIVYTVNVLSAKSTDECLRTKSQDN